MKHLYQPLFARRNPEIETVTAKRGEVVKFLPARRNAAPAEAPEGMDQSIMAWNDLPPSEQEIIWMVDFAPLEEVPDSYSGVMKSWHKTNRQERVAHFDLMEMLGTTWEYFDNTADPRVEVEFEEETETPFEETDDDGGISLPRPWDYRPVTYTGGQSWDTLSDAQRQVIYFVEFAENYEAPEGVDADDWFNSPASDRIEYFNVVDDPILMEYFSTEPPALVDLLQDADRITREYIDAITGGAAALEADSMQFIAGIVVNTVLELKEYYVESGNPEDVVDSFLIERLPNALHLFLFTAFPTYNAALLLQCFEIVLEAEDYQAELNHIEGLCAQMPSRLDNQPELPAGLAANAENFCLKTLQEQQLDYYENIFPWEAGVRTDVTAGTGIMDLLYAGLAGLTYEEIEEMIGTMTIDDSPIQDIAAASNKKKPMQLGTKIGLGLTAVLLGRGLYVAYKYSQGERVNYFGTLLDARGPIPSTPTFGSQS